MKNSKFFKFQYIYNFIIGLVFLFGVSHALVFFLYGKSSEVTGIASGLVSIDLSETGEINLTNLTTQTDAEGLTNPHRVMNIANTSNGAIKIKVLLNPNENSTLDITNIRRGFYVNNVLESIDNLPTTGLVYEGLLVKGEQITFELCLWLDNYYVGSGEVFSGEIQVLADRGGMVGTQYISSLINNNVGVFAINTSGELATVNDEIREYRYSSNIANNYVWFNCEDDYTDPITQCELWRIIGSFEDEQRYSKLKLVKNTNVINRVFGTNNSFVTSSIMSYLNNTYYDSLLDSAKLLIHPTGLRFGTTNVTDSGKTIYDNETKYIYEDYKVGLLSASDVAYSSTNYTVALNDPNVYTNSWLKGSGNYTTLSPSSSTTDLIGITDNQIATNAASSELGIKPTVYLKPSVSLINGNGTIDKPYELVLLSDGYYNQKNLMLSAFPSAILDNKALIKEVYFINQLSSISDTKYAAATVKVNLTNQAGKVLAWLEDSITESGKYNLYIASQGTTYLTSGTNLFKDFTTVEKIYFGNINTSLVTNMDYMFENCYMLTDYSLTGFDYTNVTSRVNMLNNVGISS